MKATKNKSILPLRLRQAISKLGADIAVARRKRSLTVGMMAERIGVHKNTYLKVEKGDPTVAFGIYAMALFALGLSNALTASKALQPISISPKLKLQFCKPKALMPFTICTFGR